MPVTHGQLVNSQQSRCACGRLKGRYSKRCRPCAHLHQHALASLDPKKVAWREYMREYKRRQRAGKPASSPQELAERRLRIDHAEGFCQTCFCVWVASECPACRSERELGYVTPDAFEQLILL